MYTAERKGKGTIEAEIGQNMRKLGRKFDASWQVKDGGPSGPRRAEGFGGNRSIGKVDSLMQSREQRFAAFASMARRDIEQSMLICADGHEESLATPGAVRQMRMQMQGNCGWYRPLNRQDNFEEVQKQFREQRLFLQQLQKSQQEQNILQQQLLKLITYGMIGGVRASTGPSRVEEDVPIERGTAVTVEHVVHPDPPVKEELTESAGNTVKTVITWLQGRVRGEPGFEEDRRPTCLSPASNSRLERIGVAKPDRSVKAIRKSTSLTSESDVRTQQASVRSESNFGSARSSTSDREPVTNISAYVILPLRRPIISSKMESVCSPPRERNEFSSPRKIGKSKETPLSHLDVQNESGNVPSQWQLNSQEDSIRRRWLNPAMEKAIHSHQKHDRFSLSSTSSLLNEPYENASPSPHRGDKREMQNAFGEFSVPAKEGGDTRANEERKAKAWLTEMILDAVLDEVGRELGSLCDEFVDHICSCEFWADDVEGNSAQSRNEG